MAVIRRAIPLVVLLAAGEVWAQCSPLHPNLCDLAVASIIEQSNLERAVDIVFVGDGFTDLEAWRAVAAAHIRAIREEQVESRVYAAVPEVYNFHVVDVLSETDEVGDEDLDDTALGMRATDQESITGDLFRAAQATQGGVGGHLRDHFRGNVLYQFCVDDPRCHTVDSDIVFGERLAAGFCEGVHTRLGRGVGQQSGPVRQRRY